MSTETSVPGAFRTAVRANAAFCGLSGLAIALLASRLPALLGAGDPTFYLWLGVFLVVYGVHLGLTARRERIRRVEGLLIVGGDVAWVVGSVVAVAVGVLTPSGIGLVLAVAAVVGAFALWQWRALARER